MHYNYDKGIIVCLVDNGNFVFNFNIKLIRKILLLANTKHFFFWLIY